VRGECWGVVEASERRKANRHAGMKRGGEGGGGQKGVNSAEEKTFRELN